jgi:hypothetical protein
MSREGIEMSNLPFRNHVRFALECKKYGYYATRQRILKSGGNQFDVAKVLAFSLRMQGDNIR